MGLVNVLLVNVCVEPRLTNVSVAAGNVYEYAPDTTKVEAKLPEMVNVLAALFATPVPPFAVPNIPVTPVVSGNPVALVNVPLVGVPKAPP